MFKEILFSKPRTVQKRITASGWVLKATTAALKTVIHIGRVNIQWISMQLLWTLPKPGMECVYCKTESLNTAIDVACKKPLLYRTLSTAPGWKSVVVYFLTSIVTLQSKHTKSQSSDTKTKPFDQNKPMCRFNAWPPFITNKQTHGEFVFRLASSYCLLVRTLARTLHLSCR